RGRVEAGMPRILAAAVLAALLLAAPALADDPPAPPGAGLGAGQFAFWQGPTISSGDVQDPSLCDVAAPCPTYALKLTAPGARLRVALDSPSRDNTFHFDVIDPSGAVAAGATNSNQFDAEAFIADPKPGT